MATIITNRATVNYNSGTAAAVAFSNTTSTVLNGSLSITKYSLSSGYRTGQELTYIITVTNNRSTPAQTVSVTDNLGTFTDGTITVTPLTYVGTAQLFINGAFVSDLDALVGTDNVLFEIASIPAGGTAQIFYRARVNEFACANVGAEIINNACVDYVCDCACDELICDSFTLPVEEYADITVAKSVCPNPVTCGERLNYVIDIYNNGNIDASDIVITDVFDPALEGITVSLNGTALLADGYSYVGGVLTISSATGTAITVPAAVCTRDQTTGIATITPGKISVAVSGTL